MHFTDEDLWGRLYDIGNGDAAGVPAEVVAKLVEFKIAEMGADDKPHLTPYGEKCYVVMESGDGRVPEFEDFRPVTSPHAR